MFVIVNNGNVILGPMKWHARRFTEVIEEDCELTVILPTSNDPETYYEVNDQIKIYPIVGTPNPEFNPRIEFLQGPFYEYIDGIAYSSMRVEQLPLLAAQNFVKADAANARWSKQNSGTKVIVNGVEYNFATTLETKSVFHQYITAGLETVNWKIDGDTWIVLNKQDIQNIFNAIVTHVQEAFDWEMAKLAEINDTTHETLSDVGIQ